MIVEKRKKNKEVAVFSSKLSTEDQDEIYYIMDEGWTADLLAFIKSKDLKGTEDISDGSG